MSYSNGFGQADNTASDWAAGINAAGASIAAILRAGQGQAAATDPATGLPYGTAPVAPINPATGLPYPALNPATGRPYGAPPETSMMPMVIGGIVILGVVGFLVAQRRRVTPNRRPSKRRRNMMWANGKLLFHVVKARGYWSVYLDSKGRYPHPAGQAWPTRAAAEAQMALLSAPRRKVGTFGTSSIAPKPRRNPRSKLSSRDYVWDWVGGGYNSARASSLAEAERLAKEMGLPSRIKGGMTRTLTPKNVRAAKPGEIAGYDRAYSFTD